MRFKYFNAEDSLGCSVSSYYDFETEVAVRDYLRADIPNLRFILDGAMTVDLPHGRQVFPAGSSLVCGPTFEASIIEMLPGTRIFGLSLLPRAWVTMFPSDRDRLTDRFVDLTRISTEEAVDRAERIHRAPDVDGRIACAAELVGEQIDEDTKINEAFLAAADEWFKGPGELDVENLVETSGLSQRQVERLCKTYFGAGPKKIFRKFRALYAANQMMWQGVSDWRRVAASTYYDQAHFIREFKTFNGQTPSEFLADGPTLARLILEERQRTGHRTTFSLIS